VGLVALESRNLRQKAGNDALDDLQHRREQLRLGGEQDAQWNREGEHPLPYRHVRDEVIDRRAAVCAMRRAPHAGQRPRRLHEKATSLSWPHPPQRSREKAVRENAALEKGGEFLLHELGQARPGFGLDVGEEGLGMFLDPLIQLGLFRAAALVVNDCQAAHAEPLGP